MHPDDFYPLRLPDPETHPYDWIEYLEAICPRRQPSPNGTGFLTASVRRVALRKARVSFAGYEWRPHYVRWFDKRGGAHYAYAQDARSPRFLDFLAEHQPPPTTRIEVPRQIRTVDGLSWCGILPVQLVYYAVPYRHDIYGWADPEDPIFSS